jgi:beta-lactamase regulating signal transducer with metallopeptidase domain
MTLFLIDAVIKATILLAAAAIVSATLLRRASAAQRHMVWTLALVAALALPLLTVALPRWQMPVVQVSEAALPSSPAAADFASSEMAARLFKRLQSSAPRTVDAQTPADNVTPTQQASLSWMTIALAAWLAGAAVILGRLTLGLLGVQVLSRRTKRATDAPWLPLAQELAHELRISHVTFREGRQSSMPMAWGLWRASVTLPEDASTWPEDRLRIVLLHELAHVKRRDCLTHILAQVSCAFYWFNPLAWVAARHVRAERERACDDLVLASGTPGADYADQLLEIARVMRAGRFSSVVAGASLAMANRSQLEGRLMAILDPSVPRTGVSRARRVAVAAVAAVTIVPLASLQAWEFTNQPSPAPEPIAVAAAPQAVPTPTPRPAPQAAVQGDVQGAIQGAVQGTIQGTVQGAIQGAIQGGIQGGLQGGIEGGVRGGIVGPLAGMIETAVQNAKPVVAREVAREVTPEVDEQDAKTKADPKVIAALTAALKDTDKDVRETALHALVRLRDPNVFEPLMQALKDGSPDMREQAAFGLGQMRDKRAVDPLIGAVKDTDPDVREQAVFALGQIRDPRAVEALIPALKDTHANVREQAAFALGQFRATGAVDALVAALKDTAPNVREQAAFALGQIRDPRAIDGLTTALKDTSASVRQQAAFALGQLAR